MPADSLLSTQILPVRCPRCGEAQNTVDGTTDPLQDGAQVGCMVCGYQFSQAEYRMLMDERRIEFAGKKVGDG